jgi:cytochrome c oxidase cbb3-type subunit 2
VFHVFVNRFVPGRVGLQIGLGALYGLLMWVVNHQVVIAWLQPALVGRPFVLEMMPPWVAIGTHLSYGLTLGVLQPFGRFVPYRPPAGATIAALVLACVLAVPARAADPAALRAEGARVYATYCAGCHGDAGDGRGPAAEMLLTKPRDFTKGVFKFRSTPNGTLPTDDDLLRIVTRGVYRTSMPEWSLLSDRERLGVVAYLKGFYAEWDERGAGTPIPIPPPPADLAAPERLARGRELYVLLECGACHGPEGRGDGPSAKTLAPDAWGNPQKPFNFTKGRLKAGGAPEDVYRTFMTGLNGTAMPSFGDIFLEPDGEYVRAGDGWNLVAYILSLRARPATTGPRATEFARQRKFAGTRAPGGPPAIARGASQQEPR